MNKDFSLLKKESIKLRKKGLSYNEIKQKIPVSKSTLSLWLKDTPLSPEHKKRLYTKQIEILSRGPQSQKERRKREIENIINKAKEEIKLPLSKESYRFFGSALYWAEGSKTKHLEIANSDPYLVLFMIKWFENTFGIKPEMLKAYLNFYSQQNETKIKKFWSNLTGIPLKNFGKSYMKPPSNNFKKNNLYYGTIKIYVPKGTDMRHRIFGWLKAALQDIEPEIQLTQKKWISLTETQRPINLKNQPSITQLAE